MKIGRSYFIIYRVVYACLYRIDVVMTFQILADIAKTNTDILETIQLLAQRKYQSLKEEYFKHYSFFCCFFS